MAFGWLMPVHREPSWIETIVDEGLYQLQAHIDRLTSINDMTTKWKHRVLHQPTSVFFTIIGVSILWILLSQLSSWRYQCVVETLVPRESSGLTSPGSSTILLRVDKKNTLPTNENVVHRVLNPPTYRSAGIEMNVSRLRNDYPIVECTGRVPTPGNQTPFFASPNKQNFSALAETAPISYDTLQRNGILARDGTPTKKYSPGLVKGKKLALGDEEAVDPYDTLTRTSRRSKQSPRATEKIQRQTKGVKALWVDDPDDVRVQHFSPVKGL
ncbi:hypothetical protein N0V95_007243 [Ascochyta clinopodiicola]|nr:hypothetical protein N0V95_007243 [Ascochyta clinopodiicola]